MKSKTNLGGLLSTIGLSLSGGGILTQLTQLFPKAMNIPNGILIACWYITLAGIVLKGVGMAMTSYYAADDADLQAVKSIVIPPTTAANIPDKILTPPTPKTP